MSTSWQIVHYETVDSTQHVAADLIAAGAAHRTVVVAGRQTAGYGRKGDVWRDLPGAALLATVILRPPPAMSACVACYGMAAALAVVGAIAPVAGTTAAIKWPNDVLLGGRKVAGILGDATWVGGSLVALRLGIGVNVRGDDADFAAHGLPDATSIATATGRDATPEETLQSLLRHLAAWDDLLAVGESGAVVAAWRAAICTVGHAVRVERMDGSSLVGSAAGVTDGGDLLLHLDGTGEIIVLDAASVRSLRHRDAG